MAGASPAGAIGGNMDRIVNLNDEKTKLIISVEDRTFEISRLTLKAQSMISNWMQKAIEAYQAAQAGADELRGLSYKEGDDIDKMKADLKRRVDSQREKLQKVSDEVSALEADAIAKVLTDNGIEYDATFWTEDVDASIPATFLRKVYSKDSDGSTQKKTQAK
jgi:hypothetical protein